MMRDKYVLAKTFKDKGSVVISIDAIEDLFEYVNKLEETFGRKVEFSIISVEQSLTLDEAWPEFVPIELTTTKKAFEDATTKKITVEPKKKRR